MGVPVFPKEAQALLGKLSDKEIAKKFTISARTVSRKRNLLKIDRAPRYEPLTKRQQAIALDLPNAYAATRHGMSVAAVKEYRERHGIIETESTKGAAWKLSRTIIAQMGKRPDAEVARIAKLSVPTIAAYRKAKGIPAYRPPQSERLTPKLIKILTENNLKQSMEKTGWSRQKVSALRDRIKIGVSGKKNTPKGVRKAP